MVTRALHAILRFRFVVLSAYAVLVPAAAFIATRIPSQGAIDRLIVPGDPDVAATRAFQAIFPESQIVLFVLPALDPFAPETLARLGRLKDALAGVPRVSAFSAIDALQRARPGADAETLRRLANGTAFFRRQGLVGDGFLTVLVNLDVHGAA